MTTVTRETARRRSGEAGDSPPVTPPSAAPTSERDGHAGQPPAGERDDAYRVRLPVFEGPLDLLLHLIERNQLEITAISLVAVTDQFVEYLHAWEQPPLPRLAEFVAMAARLLLIKSRSLLPRQPRLEVVDDESDPLDDAEHLRRHLIEYKMAKEIAQALKARELAGLHTFARPSRPLDAEAMVQWAPPQLVGLNVQALAVAFRRALAQQRMAEPEELPLPLVTVAEKIAEIEALLRERETTPLDEALRTATTRFAVVVTFLAALELWHQSRILITQEALFGVIELRKGPKFGQGGLTSSFDAPQSVQSAATPSEPSPQPDIPEQTSKPRRSKAKRATPQRDAAELAMTQPALLGDGR